MDDQFLQLLGRNCVFFAAVSIVLNVISSAIQGNEATTSRLTKLACRILDSVGSTLMTLAIFGFFFGKH